MKSLREKRTSQLDSDISSNFLVIIYDYRGSVLLLFEDTALNSDYAKFFYYNKVKAFGILNDYVEGFRNKWIVFYRLSFSDFNSVPFSSVRE